VNDHDAMRKNRKIIKRLNKNYETHRKQFEIYEEQKCRLEARWKVDEWNDDDDDDDYDENSNGIFSQFLTLFTNLSLLAVKVHLTLF
jgi:hypothetical protein